MTKLTLISALAITFLANVTANSQDLTVSIVGREQSHNWPYKRDGLPLVYYAPALSGEWPNTMDWTNGEPTAYSFFVVIQNSEKATERMSASASAWYDCLQFTITDKRGKIYHFSRREFIWTCNPIDTWILPGGGTRIVSVDFTSGGWQGLPPSEEPYPEVVTMTVTFRYPDSSGKMALVSSSPTNVYLCSEGWTGNAADPKKIKIPGFSIGTPLYPGGEFWMVYPKPTEMSRYWLTNETLVRPLVLTILRYPGPDKAKKAFEASWASRQVAPKPIKLSHWDAAHRWTTDVCLLKGDYVVALYDLPLEYPPAKTSKLFEALADYIAKAEPGEGG